MLICLIIKTKQRSIGGDVANFVTNLIRFSSILVSFIVLIEYTMFFCTILYTVLCIILYCIVVLLYVEWHCVCTLLCCLALLFLYLVLFCSIFNYLMLCCFMFCIILFFGGGSVAILMYCFVLNMNFRSLWYSFYLFLIKYLCYILFF